MESSKVMSGPDSFMRQMLQNKILMLTVLLAVSAAVYLCVGLYMMLG